MTATKTLASTIRFWRERQGLSAAATAKLLGMPLRTLEGIEQGRTFRYATLLTLSLTALSQKQKTPAR